jgi:hypothetical protein
MRLALAEAAAGAPEGDGMRSEIIERLLEGVEARALSLLGPRSDG